MEKKREEHRINIAMNHMPLVYVADHVYAEKPFLHIDRTAAFHILIYVKTGYLAVVEDETEYQIHPGELLFLKAGIHHYGVTPSAPDTSWIYVHFYIKDLFCSSFDIYCSHVRGQEFTEEDHDYSITLPKCLSSKKGSALEEKLNRLTSIFHSSDALRAGYLNPLLQEILLDCIKMDHEESTEQKDKVYELITYLELHTEENFSAVSLSKHFYMSYKYLEKIFCKRTGKTLLEYHTELRMNKAAKLLRETAEPIGIISEKMGYTDPFYFSNVFHKNHGVSPREYRKRFL